MSLVLRIPCELVSPNRWNGRHWRVKHRISQDWEKHIGSALCGVVGAKTFQSVLYAMCGPKAAGYDVAGKMRVTVERQTPSARNFIRDDDNLRFSVKPLLDALKRQGYIKNDSRKWLEHPTPTQTVSDDGKYWTVVTLEAVN